MKKLSLHLVFIIILFLVPNIFAAEWIPLSIDTNGKNGVFFKTEGLWSDIPLPDVVDLSGKAKFIESINGKSDALNLGYIINVEVAPLDLEKVPQMYKEELVEVIKGREIAWQPIEQVIYEVAFEFFLKDADGFTLRDLISKKHDIYSGKQNRYQDIVIKKVPISLVKRISSISFHVVVGKCVTCVDKFDYLHYLAKQKEDKGDLQGAFELYKKILSISPDDQKAGEGYLRLRLELYKNGKDRTDLVTAQK